MAISPARRSGFLQQTSERRTQRNITNFRLRTGQRFPDIARGRLFEQDLVTEQVEKQQQARTALTFRQQEESEKQFEKKLAFAEESRAQEARQQRRARKEQKREDLNKALFGPFAPIASAIT